MFKKNWRVSVVSTLDGHFVQKTGPNKPGTECIVSLRKWFVEQRILVRIYADNVSRGPKQSIAVVAFVNSLLQSGWTPDQYKGEPGELVVPMRFNVPPTQDFAKRWWRCLVARHVAARRPEVRLPDTTYCRHGAIS
jgi:hypothetical protein